MSLRFYEDEHKYFFKNRELSGITSVIGRELGISYPSHVPHIQKAMLRGSAIHKEVEDELNGLDRATDFEARWVLDRLYTRYPQEKFSYLPEFLVSDFRLFASSIDILVVERGSDNVVLIDIKTGVFKQTYCEWQLGIYDLFLRNCIGEVNATHRVYNTKVFQDFPVLIKDNKRCQDLLDNHSDLSPSFGLEDIATDLDKREVYNKYLDVRSNVF